MTDAYNMATSVGEARITVDKAAVARATLVLGHGAGGGIDAPDLLALAKALPAQGITVVRVEQPYRVAGKKVGPRPEIVDQAWVEIVTGLTGQGVQPRVAQATAQPFVVGGRSAGARVACRTAKQTGAAAVVALAFPLHPPGRPEKSRAAELLGSGVPTLVVQGDRDAFGKPEEFPPGDFDLYPLAGADHSLGVPKSAQPERAELLKIMAGIVGAWLASVLD